MKRYQQPRKGRPRNLAQPHRRRRRRGRRSECADRRLGGQGHRPDLRDRRRIRRRDQTLVVRPPRRVVAAPEPGLAHPRPGEGQPLREIFGEGRRDCHRRSLPGVEKGGADPRRRGERADPAQGGADSQRLLPQGGHHQGYRQVGRDEQ